LEPAATRRLCAIVCSLNLPPLARRTDSKVLSVPSLPVRPPQLRQKHTAELAAFDADFFSCRPCDSASPVGEERCLDALTVVLSQECERGDKSWCASTLELQQVSLGFCRPCRSAPTLAVHVQDYSTPRSLWFRRRPPNPHGTHSSDGRVLSRVPGVRARRLTWGLPVRALAYSAAVEL